MTVSKKAFFLVMTAMGEIYGRKLSEPTLAWLHQGLPPGLTDEALNLAARKYMDGDHQYFPTPGQLLRTICEERKRTFIDGQGRTEFAPTGELQYTRAVAAELGLNSQLLHPKQSKELEPAAARPPPSAPTLNWRTMQESSAS